jgi:hypothetical protein
VSDSGDDITDTVMLHDGLYSLVKWANMWSWRPRRDRKSVVVSEDEGEEGMWRDDDTVESEGRIFTFNDAAL